MLIFCYSVKRVDVEFGLMMGILLVEGNKVVEKIWDVVFD